MCGCAGGSEFLIGTQVTQVRNAVSRLNFTNRLTVWSPVDYEMCDSCLSVHELNVIICSINCKKKKKKKKKKNPLKTGRNVAFFFFFITPHEHNCSSRDCYLH